MVVNFALYLADVCLYESLSLLFGPHFVFRVLFFLCSLSVAIFLYVALHRKKANKD